MAGTRSPCFFWWCKGVTLALLLVACVTPPPVGARRRRIFHDCTERHLEESEDIADLVVSAIVERLLHGGAQVSARVKRVFKGPRELNGSVVLVEGLDGEGLCDAKLREGDTRLFLLEEVAASMARTRVLASPLRITLPNLDKLQAAVHDEPYRRRLHERDLPCESKYCPWNGDCSESRLGVAQCSCPGSCAYDPQAVPVCGLDGVTYASRCKLRVDSCRQQKRLWAKTLGACQKQPLFYSPRSYLR